MVFRREAIDERLKELARILQELSKYQNMPWESLQNDLSQRWIIERGLIAAASVIFDIADHILAGRFASYADTYAESLQALRDHQVISEELYRQIRGLGGLRNILVHRYLQVDVRELFDHYQRGLQVFPRFAQEVLTWLNALEP
jgi:uncharacterized protein YutE (UPF0331/DUF86 family)